MIMDRSEADAVRLEDGAYQFTDAHTRARRGARLHMTQIEQSIATVDDGDMELLLCRPAEDWLGDGGEVRWSLHTGALRRLPRG